MPGRDGLKGEKGDYGSPGFQGETGQKGEPGIPGFDVRQQAFILMSSHVFTDYLVHSDKGRMIRVSRVSVSGRQIVVFQWLMPVFREEDSQWSTVSLAYIFRAFSCITGTNWPSRHRWTERREGTTRSSWLPRSGHTAR